MTVDEVVARGLRHLASVQNVDGGWGYKAGGMDYVEPTAASLIAFVVHDEAAPEGAWRWLRRGQRPDGAWSVDAGGADPLGASPRGGPSWMTAWAVWALALGGEDRHAVDKGVQWLLQAPVFRVTDDATAEAMRRLLDLDPAASGWPWQPGEASWVMPTALAIIALNVAGQGGATRVADGVAYLRDRVCAAGGWNFGNPVMIGRALPPQLPETGVALLALRACGASPNDPVVTKALSYMAAAARISTGAQERAWAALGQCAWGASADGAELARTALQDPESAFGASVLALALSVAALAPTERLLGR